MSLQEVNLGRIIFMWKSDWEENKQYYLYDIVRVEKVGLFFCKTPHISNNETKPKEESDLWSLAFDFSHDIKVDKLGGIPANQYVTLEYLTQHINTKINNIETKLNNNLTDINNKIAKKADKSEVTSSAEINNRINTAKTALQGQITSSVNSAKTEITNQTDTKINTAKSELNNAISKKANSVDIYTRTECNNRFLGINAKASDSDKLDGLDSSYFAVKSDSYTKTQIDSKITNLNNDIKDKISLADLQIRTPSQIKITISGSTTKYIFNPPFPTKCIFVLAHFRVGGFDGESESYEIDIKTSGLAKDGFSGRFGATGVNSSYQQMYAFGY